MALLIGSPRPSSTLVVKVVGPLALLLCLSWSARGAEASSAPAREYQVKAVFLFNFTRFVEWPVDAFPERGAPMVIGVLGEDPFGSYLDETVRGEMAYGRQLVVKRYQDVSEIKNCHVLYVSRSEASQLAPILASLKGRSTLTVGDGEAFTRSGGVIGFASVAGKLRLRINLDAAREARLTISSNLLRPAQIVSSAQR